jgi:hypothetical protein
MVNLNNYNNDGANHQARAVLAMLQGFDCIVESSWNDELKKYDAEPKVARWENCREQGYVVSLRTKDYKKQLNIAFFEHRNSDCICAVMWEQVTLNSPTIDNAEFGDVYKNKSDVSHEVRWGEIKKMSDWIVKELIKFWEKNSK